MNQREMKNRAGILAMRLKGGKKKRMRTVPVGKSRR
jgi:hypothetical protein